MIDTLFKSIDLSRSEIMAAFKTVAASGFLGQLDEVVLNVYVYGWSGTCKLYI